MELLNKSGIVLVGSILAVGLLIACQAKEEMAPSKGQIEATALSARKNSDTVAESRMVEWAAQGLPLAQRELADIYRTRPGMQAKAVMLLQEAVRSGDAEAEIRLRRWMQASRATAHHAGKALGDGSTAATAAE